MDCHGVFAHPAGSGPGYHCSPGASFMEQEPWPPVQVLAALDSLRDPPGSGPPYTTLEHARTLALPPELLTSVTEAVCV